MRNHPRERGGKVDPPGKRGDKLDLPGGRGDKVDPPPGTTSQLSASTGVKGRSLIQPAPKVTQVHKSKSPRKRIPRPLSKAARSVRFVVDSDPSDEEAGTKEEWDHVPKSRDERSSSPDSEGSTLTACAKAELGHDECEIVDIVNRGTESDHEGMESDRSLQLEEVEIVDSENDLSVRADEIVEKVMGVGQKKAVVQGNMGSEPQATPAL